MTEEATSPLDIAAVLGRLATWRPVFHSEADFQHALAWQIQTDHPEARIRLETRPIEGRSLFLDLSVRLGQYHVAFELKYLVKKLSVSFDEERFELRSQQAHDVRRYDVIKDVQRLEDIVATGAADEGLAVIITNDGLYWNPSAQQGTIDAAFHLFEGRILGGQHTWEARAGGGTTAGRTDALHLVGAYTLGWTDYSDLGVPAGHFRALVIRVVPNDDSPVARDETQPAANDAAPTASPTPDGPGTCRQAVLDAFASLKAEQGRTAFTADEIVDRVRRGGGRWADATVRTHVVAHMSRGGPDRPALLERVDRGLYRRR